MMLLGVSLVKSFVYLFVFFLVKKVRETDGVGFSLKQFIDGQWCYLNPSCGPSTWPATCQNGLRQSPIDLRLYESQITLSPIFLNYYQYEDKAQFTTFLIQNNGHTVDVQYETQSQAPVLLGPYFDSSYVFAQLHFHWGSNNNQGSEHRIYGRSYPAELHMVHYSSRYTSLAQAVASTGDPSAIAVLAIFLQPSFFDNQALAPIIDSIALVNPFLPTIPEVPSERLFNPVKLLPWKSNFYRYMGSLTTPNCDEKVVWTVFEQPIKISKRQLEVLRNIRNQAGETLVDNFRNPQPLNGRTVTYYQVTYHLFDVIVGLCRQFISLIKRRTLISFMSLADRFQKYMGYRFNFNRMGLISFNKRRSA